MKKLLYILPVVALMGFVLAPHTQNTLKDITIGFIDSGIIINEDTFSQGANYKDIKKHLGAPDKTDKKKKRDHYIEEGILVLYKTDKMDSVSSIIIAYQKLTAGFFSTGTLYTGKFLFYEDFMDNDTKIDYIIKKYESRGVKGYKEGDKKSFVKKIGNRSVIVVFSDNKLDLIILTI